MSPLQIAAVILAVEYLTATFSEIFIEWHSLPVDTGVISRLRASLSQVMDRPLRPYLLVRRPPHCDICARADLMRLIAAAMFAVTLVTLLSVATYNTIVMKIRN
jgi:hypothetical protein